jgi:hypothetical protein
MYKFVFALCFVAVAFAQDDQDCPPAQGCTGDQMACAPPPAPPAAGACPPVGFCVPAMSK